MENRIKDISRMEMNAETSNSISFICLGARKYNIYMGAIRFYYKYWNYKIHKLFENRFNDEKNLALNFNLNLHKNLVVECSKQRDTAKSKCQEITFWINPELEEKIKERQKIMNTIGDTSSVNDESYAEKVIVQVQKLLEKNKNLTLGNYIEKAFRTGGYGIVDEQINQFSDSLLKVIKDFENVSFDTFSELVMNNISEFEKINEFNDFKDSENRNIVEEIELQENTTRDNLNELEAGLYNETSMRSAVDIDKFKVEEPDISVHKFHVEELEKSAIKFKSVEIGNFVSKIENKLKNDIGASKPDVISNNIDMVYYIYHVNQNEVVIHLEEGLLEDITTIFSSDSELLNTLKESCSR